MGGYGSGRWGWEMTRIDTDGLLFLDVRHLARHGYLTPGAHWLSWLRRGEPAGNIVVCVDADDPATLILDYRIRQGAEPWRPVRERVALAETACHYGGARPWFRCPGCGSRRAVLYSVSGRFRCRACHDLAYSSTRETGADRMRRRADAVQKQLGGRGRGGVWDSPPKPKGMHWQTYERLLHELRVCEFAAMRDIASRGEALIARLDRKYGPPPDRNS